MYFHNLALLTDSEGKIHVFNLTKNEFESNHAIQDKSIKFKQISSCSKYAWAIGSSINETGDRISDQVLLFVPSPDVPIRQESVTFENQRKYLIVGFSSKLLPTDRPAWSDVDGMKETPKDSFHLPSDHWEWESDWFVEDNLEGVPLGPQGWSYALDFPMDYGPEEGHLKWVRRRKWIRRKRFVSINKWISIPCDIPNDVSASQVSNPQVSTPQVSNPESFIDVAIGSNTESNGKGYIVWAITSSNKVVHRLGLNYNECPEGSSWSLIPDQFVKMKSIRIGANNVIWTTSVSGDLFVRSGVRKECPSGHSWAPVASSFRPGIDPRIRRVSVGLQAVWVVTEESKVFVRTGIGNKAIASSSRKVSSSSFYNSYETFLTGTTWVDMDANMNSVAIGWKDQVFAIGTDGRSLFFRGGVDANEPKGKFWELIKTYEDANDLEEDLDRVTWTCACVSGIKTEYDLGRKSNKSGTNSPAHAHKSSSSMGSLKLDRMKLAPPGDKKWKKDILMKLSERKEREMNISFLDSYQESIDQSDPISWIKSGVCKYSNPNNVNQLIDAMIDIGKSDYSSTGVIKISIFQDKNRSSTTTPSRIFKEEVINFIDVTCVYTQVNTDKNHAHSFIVIKTFKDGSVRILFTNDNDFNEWFSTLNDLINECFIENKMVSKCPDFWSRTESGNIYQGFKITEQDYFVRYAGGGHFDSVSSCANYACADLFFGSSHCESPPIAYAVTCDGHLYHFTTLGDHFPIVDTMTYYMYENQRWNPLTGFSNFARLPSDRSNWTDETGRIELSKEIITLPSRSWKWIDSQDGTTGSRVGGVTGRGGVEDDGWEKDINETPGGTDSEGWQYALDFPFSYHPKPRMTDTVRRRRWFRKCALETTGPWILIQPVLIRSIDVCQTFWDREEDSETRNSETRDSERRNSESRNSETKDDTSDSTSSDVFAAKEESFAVWAVSLDGTALCRTNVSRSNPGGDTWIPINCPKKVTSVSICFSSDLKLSVWTVAEDGSLFLRSGIFKDSPGGVDWFQVEPPKMKCPLVQVSVGPALVTAIDFKGRLWKRVNVVHSLPMGTGWFKVTKSVQSVAISSNERNDKSIVVKKGSSVNLLSFIYDDKSNGWKQLKIPNIFTHFTFHPCND